MAGASGETPSSMGPSHEAPVDPSFGRRSLDPPFVRGRDQFPFDAYVQAGSGRGDKKFGPFLLEYPVHENRVLESVELLSRDGELITRRSKDEIPER